jgi:putative Holliday junction resolvase
MNTSRKHRASCILALDFGLRRIGIATANSVTNTASALLTVQARAGEPDWQALDKVVSEWEPELLVLGLPYNTDGSESEMTIRVRQFQQTLASRYSLQVATTDERYSSVEAEALLKTARQQRTKSRRTNKEEVDSLAAKLIAERWLQSQADDINT